MASATVDAPSDRLYMEALPLIDLRLLSQSELHALSLSSASAAADLRRCDDVVIPKIDRSVFNESAGSRKQTYSRLRLAPRKPEISSAGTISRRISKSHFEQAGDDAEREENLKIVGLLKELFAAETPSGGDDYLIPIRVEYGDSVPQSSNAVFQTVTVDVAGGGGTKRKRGRPRKNEKAVVVCENVDNGEDRDREILNKNGVVVDVACLGEDRDREILNKNGVVVDLSCLANAKDPFGPELKRRTEAMETEEELLGFLSRLEGQWGSRRKKKKFVEASDFGDALPKGWKLLLSLKKKEGHAWLICRRYISPNGRQFMSCKEVSSYLLSILGPQDACEPNSGHTNESIQLVHNMSSGNEIQQATDFTFKGDNKRDDLAFYSLPLVTSISADQEKQVTLLNIGNLGEIQAGDIFKCHKCTMTFNEKDNLLHHLLSCHKRPAKRCKLGTSISDGVIVNDGKYECQFCHKIFHERHRYNGHVGIHVKNYVKSVEASPGVITLQKSIDPVFLGEVSPRVSDMQNTDSFAKPYNATANDCLNSGYPHSKLKVGSTVETYANKCSHELSSLSQDGQDTKGNRNDKIVDEESSDKQDRDYKMANDKLGKMDKATDVVSAELNCSLGAETALSNNESNNLCETFNESYVPKCTTSRDGLDRSSESCLLAFSGNEQTCGAKNNMNGVSTSLMKEPKQDIGSESGLDEDDVSEFKQQGNPDSCSFVSFMNEQKCGFANNVTGFFTSIMVESKEESGSERGVLIPPDDEQTYGVDDNGNGVSTSKLEDPKFEEIDNNTGNKEPTIGFEGGHAGQDEDAVISIEQERSSESCSLVPSWNEQVSVVDDTVNRVSTCTMVESSKEKGSENSLLTLSGNEQTYSIEKNVNNVSTCTMEELELDDVKNSRNTELTIAFNGSQNELDVDFVTSFERERVSEGYSLVPPGDEQTFGAQNKITEFCNYMVEEPKQERISESGLLISSSHEQNNKNNMKKVSTNAMEDPKVDEVRNTWNSDLIMALGSSRTGLDADVNRSFESRSLVFSGNEQTFGVENNVAGIYNSLGQESEQKRASGSSLHGHFSNQRTCGVENNLNRAFTSSLWEGHRPEAVENSGNNELMIGFGSNHPQPQDVVTDAMWRTDEGNVLRSGLADSSLPLVQSSARFPTFDFISDKGENELFSVSQKFDSISSFEGMRSGSMEQLEYSFLTPRTNSLPEDSKVSSYDAEMEQGFDSSVWIGREALLPKMASGNQSSAICAWCRDEFRHEVVNSGSQTGSIGPLCPTCRAKISGQLNIL